MLEGLTPDTRLSVNDVLPLCRELLRCDGEEQLHLCYSLARTNFVSLTIDLLKGDFSQDQCPWACAMEYCDALLILLSRTLFLDCAENEDLVTKIVSAHLVLACRIQDRYILSMEVSNRAATTGQRFVKLYRRALQKLTNLCKKFHGLTTLTLESQWFLQIFVTDFEELSLVMLEFLHSILDYEELEALKKEAAYTQISRRRLLIILDEIVYSLSRDCSDDLFIQSARFLCRMIEKVAKMRETILSRYRGLSVFLLRRLAACVPRTGREALNEELLRQTLELLKHTRNINFGVKLSEEVEAHEEIGEDAVEGKKTSSSEERVDLVVSPRVEAAAVKIQSAWRGYYTRKRLRSAIASIAAFQVRIRSRLQRKRQEKEEALLEAELRHQLAASRRRARRERDENELELIKSLPAGQLIGQHFANRRREAAVKIQAWFRGWRERHRFGSIRTALKRERAAIHIQRWYRGHLSRRYYSEERKCAPSPRGTPWKANDKRFPTGEQKRHFLEIHRKWRSTHLLKTKTPEELELLHARTQLLLRRAIFRRLDQAAEENRRTVKMAQVLSDAQLLADELSGLPEGNTQGDTALARAADRLASRPGGSLLHCRSQPIASLARVQHLLRMRALEKPWWRQWQEEWQKAVSTGVFSSSSSLARMPTDLQDLDDSYEERAFGVPSRQMPPTLRRLKTQNLQEGQSALFPSVPQGHLV
ncbi:IQ motif containing B1 [Sparganum proliferum]